VQAKTGEQEAVGLKFEFDALMAEYHAIKETLAIQRQMQSQLDNVALTGLGLSVPLILVILERNPSAIGAMFFLPVLFFSIAFIQLRHDRQIVLDTIFIDSVLRPRMNALVSMLRDEKVFILLHEDYLAKYYMPTNNFIQWIATMSRASIGLAVGIGIIVVTLYVQLTLLDLSWQAYETWLLLVSTLLFAFNAYIGAYSARLGYKHYRFREHSEQVI